MFDIGADAYYKITKPIRLIELFGGIGSQAKALTNLGVDFEHYRLVEFDKYAIQSYNAIHGTNFITQDITQTKASDLGIVETDKYEYIVTYSFPCTDLSLAGKREGMAKGSGTRSGLLWEVERILTECEQLPQILLMENVPQVLNNDFGGWLAFLESLGYNNYYELLNAKNYGIPQNRNRCFMVSVLGDYYYEFPKPIKLDLRLKDMLESNVAEKYYLRDKMLDYCTDMTDRKGFIRGEKFNPHNIDKADIAFTITTNAGSRPTDNFIEVLVMVAEPIACQTQPINRDYKKANEQRIEQLEFRKDFLSNAVLTNDIKNCVAEPSIIQSPNCLNSKVNGKQPSVQDRNYDTNGVSTAITTGFMPFIGIKEATKKGYKEGYAFDGVNISSRMKNQRENVQKQSIQTITTSGGNDRGVITQDYRIRKLTPKECWRLMGFSDTDFDKAKESGVSNCQLYKQAGNSIVVNVLMAIFGELRGGAKC